MPRSSALSNGGWNLVGYREDRTDVDFPQERGSLVSIASIAAHRTVANLIVPHVPCYREVSYVESSVGNSQEMGVSKPLLHITDCSNMTDGGIIISDGSWHPDRGGARRRFAATVASPFFFAFQGPSGGGAGAASAGATTEPPSTPRGTAPFR